MHSFNTTFQSHPSLSSVYVVSPDETVVFSTNRHGGKNPVCPVRNLNRFYHDAIHLLADTREVCLTYGKTKVTLSPLPLGWVLIIEHDEALNSEAIAALTELTRGIPSPDKDEEPLQILTATTLLEGPLAPWLSHYRALLEEATGEEPDPMFISAINRWVDKEDPNEEGLERFLSYVEEALTDKKRQAFAEKVSETPFTAPEQEGTP